MLLEERDLWEEEVHELMNSHAQELTGQELEELASSDSEGKPEEIEKPLLNLEILVEILRLH